MKEISAFVFITLDGYYKGPDEDISWHKHGMEESEFSAENLKTGNILLFGRKTYEMMASFWPTQAAMDMYPVVAKGMNAAEKIVISRTLQTPSWGPVKIIGENVIDEMRSIKKSSARNMTLLGSGDILRQFATAGLIDKYQIMVDPVAIGKGESIFKGIDPALSLKLTGTRTFRDGCVLMEYVPS
jgi:dihydrofolate reductase